MTTTRAKIPHQYFPAIKTWSVFDPETREHVGYVERHGSYWRERGRPGTEADSLEGAKERLVTKFKEHNEQSENNLRP